MTPSLAAGCRADQSTKTVVGEDSRMTSGTTREGDAEATMGAVHRSNIENGTERIDGGPVR
jgi:hypothetical protein